MTNLQVVSAGSQGCEAGFSRPSHPTQGKHEVLLASHVVGVKCASDETEMALPCLVF